MQKAHIPEVNEIIAEHVLELKAAVDEIMADQQELMDEHRRMRVLLRRVADAVDKIPKATDDDTPKEHRRSSGKVQRLESLSENSKLEDARERDAKEGF